MSTKSSDERGLYPSYCDGGAAAQPCESRTGNLVANGGFEKGWVSPWVTVGVGSPKLPGWEVFFGDIDFGDYKGHSEGAAAGESFLDICGQTAGGIRQTLSTEPGQDYRLALRYAGHPTCSTTGTTLRMEVQIDNQKVALLSHIKDNHWNFKWDKWIYEFTARSTTSTIGFKSITNACGCMLLDEVEVVGCAADTTAAPQLGPPHAEVAATLLNLTDRTIALESGQDELAAALATTQTGAKKEGSARKSSDLLHNNRLDALEELVAELGGRADALESKLAAAEAANKCLRGALEKYAAAEITVADPVGQEPIDSSVAPSVEADGRGGIAITVADGAHLKVNEMPLLTSKEVIAVVQQATADSLSELKKAVPAESDAECQA